MLIKGRGPQGGDHEGIYVSDTVESAITNFPIIEELAHFIFKLLFSFEMGQQVINCDF